MIVYPADLFGTNRGKKLNMAINWATRGWGETPTVISHIGGFVSAGQVEIEESAIIETHAGEGVRMKSFKEAYIPLECNFFIIRPLNLDWKQRKAIVKGVKKHLGQKYGAANILAAAADGIIAKVMHKRSVQAFRTLMGNPNEPDCSIVWAYEYQLQAGLLFGMEGRIATPDDIWDFAIANPDKYKVIPISDARIKIKGPA